jgi:CubicO group peptidase (beta-lactamase class C family)
MRTPSLIRGLQSTLVLCILVAGFAFAAEPKSAQQIAKEADTYMQAQVAANKFSGSVLISRDGKILFEKGYGYANAEWKVPNTPTTKFRVGSVTKQFTATIIMKLQEEGKLNVNDLLCKYVDPCAPAWAPVTIHHLLSHTGGVVSYTEVRSTSDMTVKSTPEQVMDIVRDKPLEFTPGERYKYSNSGYVLLGMVIEKVTGKTYETALREVILTPLGMNDTGFDHGDVVLPQRADGYRVDPSGTLFNALYIDMSWPYAAGSIYSTVEDLEKWNAALYTEKVLPTAALQTMWTPVKSNYGYGWQVPPPSPATFNRKLIAHSGGVNGFSAFIARYVDDKTCIVVLSNLISSNTGAAATALAAISFGKNYSTPKVRTAIKIDPKVLEQLVGDYRLAPTFVITVTTENGRLFTQATNQGKIEAFAESETKYFLKVVDAQLTFSKDENGKVSKVVLHQNGRDTPGMKTN